MNSRKIQYGSISFVFTAVVIALILALKGGVTFTVTMFVFASIQERLSTNGKNWFAPIISAVMLFLAVQCLMGIM